jgi:hypothetical protein
MVPVGNGEVVEVVRVGIHAPCGHLMQQRLPQMRCVLVYKRDVGALAAAEALAQERGQRQAAGAAADDDDTMQSAMRGIRQLLT